MIFFSKNDDILNNKLTFSCRGHADSSALNYLSQDLVCCAVSAIAQCACLGCKEYGVVSEIRGNGRLEFMCINPSREQRVIIDTAIIGLNELKRQYPESFESEVR